MTEKVGEERAGLKRGRGGLAPCQDTLYLSGMTESAIPAEIAKLGFEDALQQLEEIVRGLEGGKGRLEESIKAYERGALLKQHCENKLREAQMKISRIVVAADGAVKAQPAEL